MNPRASDDAPVPLPTAPTTTVTPQLRRVPVGTPLATPIVRMPAVEGTAPAPRIERPRFGARVLIIAIAIASVALVAAYAMYTRAAKREANEAQFPIVADGNDAQTIEREAARWSAGKPRLLRVLAGFHAPALDSLIGVGACELAGVGLRFRASPELAAEVSAAIDEMIIAAERGRFVSIDARDQLLGQLTGPVIVAFGPTSYAYDPATGTLACAGTGTLRAVE